MWATVSVEDLTDRKAPDLFTKLCAKKLPTVIALQVFR